MNEWIRISCARPIRTVVVYNPVDCDLFTPGDLSRGSNLVLYAGNLIERKGVFALARASGTFLRCLPDANLLFVGREGTPGARRTILELAGTSAAKQIRFMDAVPQKELAQIMRRAAVFAMPSILESFGNVWAEAMASGIPVVASKSSVGPEIVPHGEAGFTVDPESPAQIADAVITLMTNTDLRARFAEVGRRVALERYSLQTSLSRTLGFYRQCLS
jgi:glycosyltransferase involved in cell wall biosynthesis